MLELLRTSGPRLILARSVIGHRSDRHVRFAVSSLLSGVEVPAGSIPISTFSVSFSFPDDVSIPLTTITYFLRLSECRLSTGVTIVSLISFLSRVHRWWRCGLVWSGLQKKKVTKWYNTKNIIQKIWIRIVPQSIIGTATYRRVFRLTIAQRIPGLASVMIKRGVLRWWSRGAVCVRFTRLAVIGGPVVRVC